MAKQKPLPTIFVTLRSVWLAPTRSYIKPTEMGRPGSGKWTFMGLREKVPEQWVMVLARTLFADSWILLLFVGGRMLWEFESDVKLWKKSE